MDTTIKSMGGWIQFFPVSHLCSLDGSADPIYKVVRHYYPTTRNEAVERESWPTHLL